MQHCVSLEDVSVFADFREYVASVIDTYHGKGEPPGLVSIASSLEIEEWNQLRTLNKHTAPSLVDKILSLKEHALSLTTSALASDWRNFVVNDIAKGGKVIFGYADK